MVYEFNPVKDIFEVSDHDDEYYEDGSGDDYVYNDDEPEDDYHEGSGDDSDVNDVKVSLVENADYILEKYGPGAVEACGVTLTQSRDNVVFAITGGKNGDGATMRKVMKTQLQLDFDGNPVPGALNMFLPEMKFARRQHGCYKVSYDIYDSADIFIILITAITDQDTRHGEPCGGRRSG